MFVCLDAELGLVASRVVALGEGIGALEYTEMLRPPGCRRAVPLAVLTAATTTGSRPTKVVGIARREDNTDGEWKICEWNPTPKSGSVEGVLVAEAHGAVRLTATERSDADHAWSPPEEPLHGVNVACGDHWIVFAQHMEPDGAAIVGFRAADMSYMPVLIEWPSPIHEHRRSCWTFLMLDSHGDEAVLVARNVDGEHRVCCVNIARGHILSSVPIAVRSIRGSLEFWTIWRGGKAPVLTRTSDYGCESWNPMTGEKFEVPASHGVMTGWFQATKAVAIPAVITADVPEERARAKIPWRLVSKTGPHRMTLATPGSGQWVGGVSTIVLEPRAPIANPLDSAICMFEGARPTDVCDDGTGALLCGCISGPSGAITATVSDARYPSPAEWTVDVAPVRPEHWRGMSPILASGITPLLPGGNDAMRSMRGLPRMSV